MFEFSKSFVVLEKDEYECLKKEASLYDPAPWCKLGICEGVRKECKDTCPDSIYTQIREKVIVDFLVSTGNWRVREAEVLMRKYMTETFGIEYKVSNLCIMCGIEIPEGRQVCPACENKLRNAIQNT